MDSDGGQGYGKGSSWTRGQGWVLYGFALSCRHTGNEGADNILEKCTAAFHATPHEIPIIYGDYYLIEAIWKLTGEELFIW